MPTAPQIDAPLSLGSFFPAESDDEQSEGEERELDQCYEIQEVDLVGSCLKIRQFAYHSHNANRVWPGTFNLAEYLLSRKGSASDGSPCEFAHHWGHVLELGTATGLLAIRLALSSQVHSDEPNTVCTDVVTSDLADDEIEEHVHFNFDLNGFDADHTPIHVPHTWGDDWQQSTQSRKAIQDRAFDTIVASDILLYVSAYPALVETLKQLMGPNTRFVMSWNRRMKESAEFFKLMEGAGYECKHEGKCVYTFSSRQSDHREQDEKCEDD